MRSASSVNSTIPRRFAFPGVGSFAPPWPENMSVDKTRKENIKNNGNEEPKLLIVEPLVDEQGWEGREGGTVGEGLPLSSETAEDLLSVEQLTALGLIGADRDQPPQLLHADFV